MTKVALYEGGNRSARAFELQLIGRDVFSAPRGVRISKGAVNQVGEVSSIGKVSDEGIRDLDGNLLKLCSVFIRPPYYGISHKVFISDKEHGDLSENFDIPLEVVDGVFFIQEGRFWNRNLFFINLHWSELLDPLWKQSFLKWIADQGRIPDPPDQGRIPDPPDLPWETLPGGTISMPALRPVLPFAPGLRGIVGGRLKLGEVGISCRATFWYGENKFSAYSLGKDNFTALKTHQVLNESFDAVSFGKLFGRAPEILEYTCSKIAGKAGVVGLCNVGGAALGIHPLNDVPLKEGVLYHLTFVRKQDVPCETLEVRCYKDPERNILLEEGSLGLNEGLPGTSRISLRKPLKA